MSAGSLHIPVREGLSPPARLALAYAPATARPIWLGVLALDARLGQVVRQAREPLIGQIRLAWWRERLAEPNAGWPHGEPLLALLRGWDDRHRPLSQAVDGWERLLGEAPLAKAEFLAAAEGRSAAFAAAAERLGHADRVDEVRAMARAWAIADLAAHVHDPREQAVLVELETELSTRAAPLPRALRPVAVLHGTAGKTGASALLAAVRLGIFGR